MNNQSVRRTVLYITIGALSLIIGVWLSQLFLSSSNDNKVPPDLDATVFPKARLLHSFNLTDHDGKPFNSETLKSHWSFLFFGFTNCPDVCPTTLKIMQSVWNDLPTKANETGHPKLYFVSVDPERDPLTTLKPYVTYFHPEFVGVTGKLDEIDKLTNQIGILYGYDEKEDDKDKEYIVNHSSQLILVDPRGRMRAVISPPHDAKMINHILQRVRQFYGDK